MVRLRFAGGWYCSCHDDVILILHSKIFGGKTKAARVPHLFISLGLGRAMNLIFTATLSFLWLIQTSSSLQYEEEPNQSSFLMKLDKSNFEATVFRSGE